MEDADPETQALVRKLHREMNGLGRRSRRGATQDTSESDRRSEAKEASKSTKQSREGPGERHERHDSDRQPKSRAGSHGSDDKLGKGHSNRERDAGRSASSESDNHGDDSKTDAMSRHGGHRPRDSRQPLSNASAAPRRGSVERDTATTLLREPDAFPGQRDPAGSAYNSDDSLGAANERLVGKRPAHPPHHGRDSAASKKPKSHKRQDRGSAEPESKVPKKIALQTAAYEEMDRASWHNQRNPIRPDLYASHRCVKCFHQKLRFGIVLSASALASRRDLARALSAALEPLGLPISRDGLSLHIIFLDKNGHAAEFRPVLPGGGSSEAAAGGGSGAGAGSNSKAAGHQAKNEEDQQDSNLEWSDVSSTAVRVYVM